MSKNPNGMGTYKKRKDGRYQWVQRQHGEYRYLYANTLKELKEKIRTVADTPCRVDKITYKEYADSWLETRIKPLTEKRTYENYKYHLESSIYPVIGRKPIQKITADDIQNVIAQAHLSHKSGETMKHVKSVAIMVLRQAKKSNLIANCPHREDVEVPKTTAPVREAHNASDTAQIIDAMKTSRWRHAVAFDLNTGIRPGELVGLKKDSIDWKNNKIHNYNIKTKKMVDIPITEEIKEILYNQYEMLLNEGLGFSEYVFPNNKGKKTSASVYSKRVKMMAKKQGIDTCAYKLRHTFVYINKNTLSLSELQQVLGHVKSTQTLDIYGKILNDDNEGIRIKMENAMSDFKEKMKKQPEKIVNFKKAK